MLDILYQLEIHQAIRRAYIFCKLTRYTFKNIHPAQLLIGRGGASIAGRLYQDTGRLSNLRFFFVIGLDIRNIIQFKLGTGFGNIFTV